jgi:hypothetical protein
MPFSRDTGLESGTLEGAKMCHVGSGSESPTGVDPLDTEHSYPIPIVRHGPARHDLPNKIHTAYVQLRVCNNLTLTHQRTQQHQTGKEKKR